MEFLGRFCERPHVHGVLQRGFVWKFDIDAGKCVLFTVFAVVADLVGDLAETVTEDRARCEFEFDDSVGLEAVRR